MYRNPLQHRGAPFSGGGEDEFDCARAVVSRRVAEAFTVAAAAAKEDYCMGVSAVVERRDGEGVRVGFG